MHSGKSGLMMIYPGITAPGMSALSARLLLYVFVFETVPTHHAQHKPLIDGSDARETIANYEDYPELFVRWFEWGAFQPIMRAHGERTHNEVWSYGKQAEPILANNVFTPIACSL
jgi:Glycosyl hydrolases family 31